MSRKDIHGATEKVTRLHRHLQAALSGSQRGRRRAPARSIPSRINASSAASIAFAERLPSAENVGWNVPRSRRFVHIAKPLRSQYTTRTRSQRFEKKT